MKCFVGEGRRGWIEMLHKECKIQKLLLWSVFVDDFPTVKTIIESSVADSKILNCRYRGYTILGWAEELNFVDIIRVLTSAGAVPFGSPHNPWSIISSMIIFDKASWVFENIKRLISKGHDVNKCDTRCEYNTELFETKLNVMAGEAPFNVTMNARRFDIMKLLLLNGAQPLRSERNLLQFFDT